MSEIDAAATRRCGGDEKMVPSKPKKQPLWPLLAAFWPLLAAFLTLFPPFSARFGGLFAFGGLDPFSSFLAPFLTLFLTPGGQNVQARLQLDAP
jgi:hypothetical protein